MPYQPLTKFTQPNRASAISNASDDLLGRRVGGYSPALQAKFRGMDEATAQAAGDNRATAFQGAARSSGAFGPGVRRAGQAANDKNLATIASSQIQQAQLAGEDQNQAMTAGINRGAQDRQEKFQNLQALQANASEMGDTTTQAALGDLYLGGSGNQYTDVGRSRIAADAAASKEESDWLRKQQDQYTGGGLKASSTPWWQRALKGAAGGAATGSAFGPYGTAVGGVAGGLAGLFT